MIVVETSEIVAHSLFITHSPRLYRDKLWLHNSGTGEFGAVEIDSGRFEPVAFAPGGLLKPRDNKTFAGLPLGERLEEKNATNKMRSSDHEFEHRRYCQLGEIRRRC